MHNTIKLFASLLMLAPVAFAATVRKDVDYQFEQTALTGVLVFDAASKTKLPGLVLVPNWMGINESNLKQAELVSKMGYVVFVADMYGKDVRPTNAEEAGKAAGVVKSDRSLMRGRMQAGLKTLLSASTKYNAVMDSKKLGAIGFCFGGTSVLELARSGAPIAGVVSFHGGLSAPTSYDAAQVKSAVLALHGADDPFVPADEVTAFQSEMRGNKLDWELISYGGAVHSFTDVEANAKGQADYNPKVAKRAYARMQQFFAELFATR